MLYLNEELAAANEAVRARKGGSDAGENGKHLSSELRFWSDISTISSGHNKWFIAFYCPKPGLTHWNIEYTSLCAAASNDSMRPLILWPIHSPLRPPGVSLVCLLIWVPLGVVAVFLGFYWHSRFYTCRHSTMIITFLGAAGKSEHAKEWHQDTPAEDIVWYLTRYVATKEIIPFKTFPIHCFHRCKNGQYSCTWISSVLISSVWLSTPSVHSHCYVFSATCVLTFMWIAGAEATEKWVSVLVCSNL